MFYVDVKITEDRKTLIVLKPTDDPDKLAQDFVVRQGS